MGTNSVVSAARMPEGRACCSRFTGSVEALGPGGSPSLGPMTAVPSSSTFSVHWGGPEELAVQEEILSTYL